MKTLQSLDISTVAWIIFVVYWLASAARVAETKEGEPFGRRFLHIAALAVAAALLFSDRLAIGLLGRRFVPDLAALKVVGTVLTVAGVSLAIWARRHLGKYWSARVTLKVDHKLIRTGPYAYARHPIYAGLFVAVTGTVLSLGQWRGVLGLVFLGLAHWQKARREDALMAQAFGQEYEEYRKQTGALMPKSL